MFDDTDNSEARFLAFLNGRQEAPEVNATPTAEVAEPEPQEAESEAVIPVSQIAQLVNQMLLSKANEIEVAQKEKQKATELAQQQLLEAFPDAAESLSEFQDYINQVGTDPSNIASWREAYFAKKSAETPEQNADAMKEAALQELYRSIQEKRPPSIVPKSGNSIAKPAKATSFEEAANQLNAILQKRR